jgi:DNA-binding PadR family transcriptional regulator
MVALPEPTFFVLAALADEPRYGYAIIAAVAELSEGRVELRAGTLYPALDRLTTDGLIELAREEVVDSRLRRYYQLTAAGVDRLASDVERQRRNAETVGRRVAARTSATTPATPLTGRRRPRAATT